MSTFLLIISAICFTSGFGIHAFASRSIGGWCGYMSYPLLRIIPWISGFVLAVIPETILFDMEWYWVFLINIAVQMILGQFLTIVFLRWFATGKGAGFDILISLIIAIVTLVIGLVIE